MKSLSSPQSLFLELPSHWSLEAFLSRLPRVFGFRLVLDISQHSQLRAGDLRALLSWAESPQLDLCCHNEELRDLLSRLGLHRCFRIFRWPHEAGRKRRTL